MNAQNSQNAKTKTDPSVVVIFGASGDLTQRKLIPALHSLACEGMLPEQTRVIGVARSSLTNDAFRQRNFEGVSNYARLKPNVCELWPQFQGRIAYLAGGYDDPETYRKLARELSRIDSEKKTRGNCLFYLATPPNLYPIIIEQLGKSGLNREAPEENGPGWRRIVIEKPFGSDSESAKKLNNQVHAVFNERQVYRIDHYLGKETVQNIMTLRFANAIFEPLWNRNFIDHIQITVAESVGLEHRAGYYDRAGVLRDVFQNHLLQLLTLTAMEPPALFNADALRDEKVKVLRSLRWGSHSVRAQYSGYCAEEGVAPDSQTPTYAALELFVDNWRWQNVPFFLRSGKMMRAKTSEIAIQFKCVPHLMFPLTPGKDITPNVLSLCIQPDEGARLRFETKRPGAGMITRSVDMEFHYAEDFGEGILPEAYERLLLDAMQGDASLFARSDEIELAWGLIDEVNASWEDPDAPPLTSYEPGSWGPKEADDLLARNSRAWIQGCGGQENHKAEARSSRL
jgi:glucose-6-phosphate 1-dehydrogenase